MTSVIAQPSKEMCDNCIFLEWLYADARYELVVCFLLAVPTLAVKTGAGGTKKP
jgi:hypothetical protein